MTFSQVEGNDDLLGATAGACSGEAMHGAGLGRGLLEVRRVCDALSAQRFGLKPEVGTLRESSILVVNSSHRHWSRRHWSRRR